MIGLGVFMVLLAFTGLFLRLRRRLKSSRLFHRLCVLGSPAGFVAILAGWVVTEVGRQPWTVHGLSRTRDSTSLVGREVVATSLGLFVLVYGFYGRLPVLSGATYRPRSARRRTAVSADCGSLVKGMIRAANDSNLDLPMIWAASSRWPS